MAGLSVSVWRSSVSAVVSGDWFKPGMRSKGFAGNDEHPPSIRQALNPRLLAMVCHVRRQCRGEVCECVGVALFMSPSMPHGCEDEMGEETR